jgi:hypothetical protein
MERSLTEHSPGDTHGQFRHEKHVQADGEHGEENRGGHEDHTPDEGLAGAVTLLAVTVDKQTDALPDVGDVGETRLVVGRDGEFAVDLDSKRVEEGRETEERVDLKGLRSQQLVPMHLGPWKRAELTTAVSYPSMNRAEVRKMDQQAALQWFFHAWRKVSCFCFSMT